MSNSAIRVIAAEIHSEETTRTTNEEINYSQPSTSGLKARIMRLKFDTKDQDELPSPLHSLDELSQRLLEQKLEMEGKDSYLTVDLCTKEMATSTETEMANSRQQRTQNNIVTNLYDSSPPPPYSFNDTYQYQGQLGSTPVYQEIQRPYTSPPRDTGRAPPYQLNYVDSTQFMTLFENKYIRNRFIFRVYIILSLQLLLSFGFIAVSVYVKEVKVFIMRNIFLMFIAMLVLFVLQIVLFCFQSARRVYPTNFCLLFLMTAAFAYIVAAMACFYSKDAVLLAVGVTAGVCLVVTFIAWQNWFDVTTWGMILCLLSFVLIVYGFIAMIVTLVTGSNITFMIYACLATMLFCLYLLYDTQQILGGGRIALSPEEYILGAVTLFVDIMNIFMFFLYIFGHCRS